MASTEHLIVVSMTPEVQAEFERIKQDLVPVIHASESLYACLLEFGDDPQGPCQEKYEHWRDVMSARRRRVHEG
jgi:hypothetical protein